MTKTTYGFRDTQYFFSKTYENSRKPTQNWLSHKILAQYRFLWDEAKAQGTIGVEKKGMRPQTCKHPN
ncbi:MAG: hypothetical protein SPF89_00545 [Sphaerochaetaceae bacterium]|nr:hypothetical protein [Sphaerochaetaceae bacterium]